MQTGGRKEWRALSCALAVSFSSIFSHAAEPAVDVERLIAQLGGADREARREAGLSLEKIGPAAKAAVPALIAALDDQDKQVWANALAALAAIGPDAAPAVPRLMELLDSRKSRDFRQRDTAQKQMRVAHALGSIGEAARPALLAALKSDDPAMRLGAVRALGEMGAAAKDAIPGLVETLGHADEQIRGEAADALGRFGADAIAPLKGALSSPDARLRAGAARALGGLGAAAAPAGPELIACLSTEKEREVRVALLAALPRTGFAQEKTVPVLVRAFRDDDEAIRSAALNALLGIRPAAKLVVPSLVAMLADPQSAVVERTARALGRFGPDARAAVPALLAGAARGDKSADVFRAALTEIGAPVVPLALRHIEKLPAASLNREHWVVRVLAGIGPPGIPELAKALGSPLPPVRTAALGAMIEFAQLAREVRPAVAKLAADSDASVRATALSVLVSMDTEPGATLKQVEAALGDPAPVVRLSALVSAAALGEQARGLAPKIAAMLDDKDASVRVAAIRAVGSAGSADAGLLDRVVARLDDPASRPAALEALGKLGVRKESAAGRLVVLYPKASRTERVAILAALATAPPLVAGGLIRPALQDSDAELRATALRAAAKMLRPVEEIVADIVSALADPDAGVRRVAIEVAGQTGGRAVDKAVPTLAPLIAMLDSDEHRREAMEALRMMQVRDEAALTLALQARSSEARTWACERIGRLGKSGASFFDKLKPLLADRNDYVRRAAQKAMESIKR